MSNNENEPVFQYTLHKRLWNILADNPGMGKGKALVDFFTEEERKEFGNSRCTACAYARIISRDHKFSCTTDCPLDISGAQELQDEIRAFSCKGICLGGLYRMWDVVHTIYHIRLLRESTKRAKDFILSVYGDINADALIDYIKESSDSEEKVKELCSKYARAIANLPVKTGVKYI